VAHCPKCDRTIDEAGGFCPFDGTPLQAAPDSPTGSGQVLQALSAKESGAEVMANIASFDRKAEYDKLVGTTLDGRYQIESKLGEGGMGVVFLARHTVIEKAVAVKVLKREVARDNSTVKRFVQEAKAASRIGHPNIVDVTDFGTTPDGMTYSVMEFVEGRTLGQVLKAEAPLPAARALPIAAQIARALAAAHAKGIVHRDLKPENVFIIDRDGRRDFVKIVDFGIAKVTPLDGAGDGPRLTRAGTVFGTPEYMAPEQAAGRPDTDGRVDVYALGTILYEMLVGKVPHKGDSMVRTLAMQMLDPIQPPREARPELEISDELEQVIMKALAKKREERYQTMTMLLAGLERAAGGLPMAQPLSASAANRQPAGAPHDPDAPTMIPRLPPGADAVQLHAADAPASRRARQGDAPAAEGDDDGAPRHDPAFVRRKRPLTLDVVASARTTEVVEPRSRRWPLAVALIALLGGAGVAAALVMRGQDGDGEPTQPAQAAAAPAIDAAVAALVREFDVEPADAGPVAALAADAAATRPGGRRGDRAGADKRPGDGPSGPRVGGPPREIQVITRPAGGTLYLDGSYSGTSGATISRPHGTRAVITCRLPGYDRGRVEVTFDGINEVYLCRLLRDGKCIPDLKNPFDDCPE
jgi:serine/threonine protein kinase